MRAGKRERARHCVRLVIVKRVTARFAAGFEAVSADERADRIGNLNGRRRLVEDRAGGEPLEPGDAHAGRAAFATARRIRNAGQARRDPLNAEIGPRRESLPRVRPVADPVHIAQSKIVQQRRSQIAVPAAAECVVVGALDLFALRSDEIARVRHLAAPLPVKHGRHL